MYACMYVCMYAREAAECIPAFIGTGAPGGETRKACEEVPPYVCMYVCMYVCTVCMTRCRKKFSVRMYQLFVFYFSGIYLECLRRMIRRCSMMRQVRHLSHIHTYINTYIHMPYIHFLASFEWFRERCGLNSSLEENKDILKDRITEAKTVGERANQSRYHIHTFIHTYMHTYIHTYSTYIQYLYTYIKQ
jgi:hypothetical protein